MKLQKGAAMRKKKSNSLFKKRLLVMIFINMCPVFHWLRNNRRILNFYYYVCLAEIDKVKNKDSEILAQLRRDLFASRDSFDKLYGLANFMNTKEYREIVASAPNKKESDRKESNRMETNRKKRN
ncbi:MAG: hypothetical protein K5879_07425 [Lachnospiraceae bacterium]|nr:hypothetical protein [Lachnospiraceae bacterium]